MKKGPRCPPSRPLILGDMSKPRRDKSAQSLFDLSCLLTKYSVTSRAWFNEPLRNDDPPTRSEDPHSFVKAFRRARPVIVRVQAPHHGGNLVGERERLGSPKECGHIPAMTKVVEEATEVH